ncbi:MAG: iron ABC transporter permease [Candidatus Bipolaricaulota bacterium]|nr:iron ABC transporter permease [Candidatus Bipolaricaulota bacterium]
MKKTTFLILPLSLLLLFFYLPLANLLKEGIWGITGFNPGPLVDLLSDPYYWDVISFTAKQAIYSTALSLAVGLPGAWILTRYEFQGRGLVRSLTAVPFVLPAITVVSGFLAFFGNNGFLNRALMQFFALDNPPLKILYSLRGIVLAHAFYNAPIVTRVVEARWADLDPTYEESAALSGANVWQSFRKILLPLLAPSIAASSALVFIFCFLSFPIVLALGGARFSTLEVEIYILVQTLGEYELGAALALVEIFLSLTFTYFYLRMESFFSVETLGLRSRRREKLFGGGVDFPKLLTFVFAILAAILFLGPVLGVLYRSFTASGSLTLNWFRRLFLPGYHALIGASPLGTIGNSLGFALGAALLSAVIGTPLAYFLARTRFRGRAIFDAIAMAPLGVSSVALGFAFSEGFVSGPIIKLPRPMVIIVAHSVLAYPFFIRTAVPALSSLEREIIESAQLAGADRWNLLWRIELPLIRKSLLAGLAFAFAISLGEMSATIMLVRPGLKTMPIAIYELISAREFGTASAMSVVLISVVGLAFYIMERTGRNFWKD